MAKETKESVQTAVKQAKKATTVKKKTTAKKATTTKKVAAKKTVAKKATSKKTATTKKAAATKKTTTKAVATTKKATTVKKVATRKKAVDSVAKKSVKSDKTKYISEYYDLPYMYNKTVVKVLAQTPKMLFIYWEVSETDRKRLQNDFGEKFFETTRPVLIVYNDTMHYSFEVAIDDFANSWYLHINDANCKYHVELGRRPRPENYGIEDNYQDESAYIPYYIYLTSSNEMTSPNNRILFDPNLKTLRFRNVKTGEVFEKDIRNFTFITNLGIFNMKDLYKYLFPNESLEFEDVSIGNPTSRGGNKLGFLSSSSGTFSSQFK